MQTPTLPKSGPQDRVRAIIESLTAAIASESALGAEIDTLLARKSRAESEAAERLKKLSESGGPADIDGEITALARLRSEAEVVGVLLESKVKLHAASDVDNRVINAAAAVRDLVLAAGQACVAARSAEIAETVAAWGGDAALTAGEVQASQILANRDPKVRAVLDMVERFRCHIEYRGAAGDGLRLIREAAEFLDAA